MSVRSCIRHYRAYRVVLGDSTLPSTYSQFEERADVLFTDPPYCILERRGKEGYLRDPKQSRKKLDGPEVPRFRDVADYAVFTRQWLNASVSNGLKESSNLVIWTNALGKAPITKVCAEMGYFRVGEYVWAKKTKPLALNSTRNEVLLRVYESALVFSKREPLESGYAGLPWAVVSGYHEEGAVSPHLHPCHKPLEVIRPLLLSWTSKGSVLLDPFAGSGAILRAAALEGRIGQGIEILPNWVKFAEEMNVM